MSPTVQRITTLLFGVFLLFPFLSFAAPIKGYCVLWLRTDRGIEVRGDAWDIVPTHSLKNADLRDVLLTYEGRGHAAEITGFDGEMLYNGYITPRYIWVIENWNGVVRSRKIEWSSSIIRGIYRPLSPTPF